jgi:hypothetical protein
VTSAAVQAKADRYLTEGRVCVINASPSRADFLVVGTGTQPYQVRCHAGWRCTCPSQVETCAHILACQKISKPEAVRKIFFTDDSDELTQFLNEAFQGEGSADTSNDR